MLAGIDTIDVSLTSTDYLALNHSSYAEKSALLDDIGLLLQAGESPPRYASPSWSASSRPRATSGATPW